ncbi:universal stress protein [Pseudomonas helvetica]|jgi:universal stress protein E|uniref:universal stress protein n=1 Tax=Pseudomonas TaxID=286 RepID=UPI003267172F
MSQYQRLLLIINPTLRHSPAIHQASALAKACGATLHILGLTKPVRLFSLLEPPARDETRMRYLQEQSRWLKNEVHALRAKGLDVTSEVRWSDDARLEILDYVMQLRPDLLLKEIQHEPLLKRAFVTPMDWYLLRECPVPVYLLSPCSHTLPRKVVAAVDPEPQGSKLNERILQQANSLALQCDAQLSLLHVCPMSSDYLDDADGDEPVLSKLRKDLRQALEKSFVTLAHDFGVPVECRHFIFGDPVSALAGFVNDNQTDVIVMGRGRHHGLQWLIGSTTEHVLYQVPCSILAV